MLGFHPIAAAPIAALTITALLVTPTGPTPAGAKWSYSDAERHWNQTHAREDVREYAKEIAEYEQAKAEKKAQGKPLRIAPPKPPVIAPELVYEIPDLAPITQAMLAYGELRKQLDATAAAQAAARLFAIESQLIQQAYIAEMNQQDEAAIFAILFAEAI